MRSRHGLSANEKIGDSCHDDSIFIKTMTTSLVPQFDATNQWDGQLLDLLPCIDFLILTNTKHSEFQPVPRAVVRKTMIISIKIKKMRNLWTI
mmetsp:Transcript_24877/g.35648  ORF Transcript_24877/g.35648 Transcript_24877/m.35648 type:complete len:93 (-) Transcript_24877:594-872(-)